eukprot:3056689-Prymnesium_polylepis.1
MRRVVRVFGHSAPNCALARSRSLGDNVRTSGTVVTSLSVLGKQSLGAARAAVTLLVAAFAEMP